MGRQQGKFRFRRLDNIGAAAAEEDIDFLKNCFVDTGVMSVLSDCRDPRSIAIGRTGSGKTALLSRLSETEERVIEILPESLSLSYISNSTVLNFFDRLGVKLDIFFKLLWRHVFAVELIKHHFKIWKEHDKHWGLYTKLAKSPAYFGLFRTRIDGSSGLALPNIRWATSSGGASSLMIRVMGRPGFFLVLWTSLRLSFMDTLPADKSCRSSH